ncbi:hypothetical protein PHET_12261 [Paragonimus heterotremus]|uniref:Immunoglobulin V-set domain-containing protein n=1 Tax=Paragonimus heterotremus TaxID=100268 RepID=A0A8J4T2I0_9TREM|nr:hypothetical protein PHET_12261 [Paragonimus heterotremus]
MRAGRSSVVSALPVALLFLFSVFISPCRSNGVVELIENGTIATALENVNLEELTFKKRHINQSVPATLKFRINSLPTPTWSFKWLLDGHELKVTRYTNTLPSKPGNVYTTELQSDGSVNLTLHLQEKGLIAGNYTVVLSDVSGATPDASLSGFVNVLVSL